MRNLINNILILLIGISSLGFLIDSKINEENNEIKIQWIDNLTGDFDFRTIWNYPEGVFRNKYGQLSCDGFCPEETESMKDKEGKINTDSLTKFYQLVDTTHQFHSILCDAWCYEWAGTDYLTAKQTNENYLTCSTHTNVGTHCSLIIEISKDICVPRIELNSISSPGLKIYYCQDGFIKIDKDLWLNGILKAEFDFNFNKNKRQCKHDNN